MSAGWVGSQPTSSRVSALGRGRAVDPEEAAQPGEVLARVLTGDREHGEVEMLPDHLGDVVERHALVRDRVQDRSCRGRLQHQAEDATEYWTGWGAPGPGGWPGGSEEYGCSMPVSSLCALRVLPAWQ